MFDTSFTNHVITLLDTIPMLQQDAILDESYPISGYLDVINEVIALALSQEFQIFSSHHAEWTFLIQSHPELMTSGKHYAALHRMSKQRILGCNEHARQLCRNILCALANLPEEYAIPINENRLEHNQSLGLFRGTIVSWERTRNGMTIICNDEVQHEWVIDININHISFTRLWKGALIHITDVIFSDYHITSTEETLCIIEPDILYTATDIAECAGNDGQLSLGSMFIKKFLRKQSGIPLLAGIIVGNWLDIRISGESTTLEEILQATIQSMPLQALSAIREEGDLEKLRGLCQLLITSLEPILYTFDGDSVSTETAFMSPLYGLTGRLDILMEYADNPLRKTVIELKSGNAPSSSLPVQLSGKSIPMGAWKNHAIQVACYNLLLDSAFPNRIGDSRLLYPKDTQEPMRNVPNSSLAKREAILMRNAIMSLEHDIINRSFASFIELFSDAELSLMPQYTREEVSAFKDRFMALDKTSSLYLLACMSFIIREHHSARIGNGRQLGLSSLWNATIDEKQDRMSAIGYMRINNEYSDSVKSHIRLEYTEQSSGMSSFRKGDIVLLYAHDALTQQGRILGHIHKASIKTIVENGFIISLRNKFSLHEQFINADTLWCIESDMGNESLVNGLLRSLGDFMHCDTEKRAMILGLIRPRKCDPYKGELPEYLHESQKELIRKALSAKDYMLVQGPPGTGKTSALIRTIVQILHDDPHEQLLLCAYTNRAVDELCEVAHALELPFLRLGNKQSTAFPKQSLQELSEQSTIDELRQALLSTRIIISTVSTLHTHGDIYDWCQPSTIIVDEASQLLEPQLIGILSQGKRWILIGDERQLPAVVIQDERGTTVNHPLFTSIGFSNLRMSLFERLLRLCKSNGDDHAYGMLTVQARMHQDIASIVSKMNYENRLAPMHAWQSQDNDIPLPEYPRLAWISTNPEHVFKIHTDEASQAIALACRALSSKTVEHIGIITPFRSQIALIQSKIPNAYREYITVDTVERFQGSERDLIIISLAIHTEHQMQSIESLIRLNDMIIDRKLNVALTRARKQCIILGSPLALVSQSPYHTLFELLTT